MMKKFLLSLMSIALMAVVCVGFTACGSDDDGDNGGGSGDIVGVWKRTYKKTTYFQQNNSGEWVQVGDPKVKTYDGKEASGFRFLPGNKAVEIDIDADNNVKYEGEQFEYKIENGKLYLLELDHPEDGYEMWGVITFSGDQFELTKEEMEGNSKELKIYVYKKIG